MNSKLIIAFRTY